MHNGEEYSLPTLYSLTTSIASSPCRFLILDTYKFNVGPYLEDHNYLTSSTVSESSSILLSHRVWCIERISDREIKTISDLIGPRYIAELVLR